MTRKTSDGYETGLHGDRRLESLFQLLDPGPDGRLGPEDLTRALAEVGLRADDPRLADSVGELAGDPAPGAALDLAEFTRLVRPNATLIERALRRELVIPEFSEFCADIERLFHEAAGDESGTVADYIPQLSRVDPAHFAVALCTIDGQRFSLGDAQKEFCVQSCCKTVNYALALEDRGEEKVHKHVGREPSGRSFNELTLNADGRPHNPLINAGGIMSCALIQPEATSAERFDYVMDMWRRLCGGKKQGFSNATYLSERRTADRNFALGYFMRENGAFPEDADLLDTLEFYFQCCSIESTAESMSVLAATFANGGCCPITDERVVRPATVRKLLTLMNSCGMYDFSGEWAFSVGLPAKSGVSGAIMVVVPNTLGLCVWSPRLDRLGNSVRGIDFCKRLTNTFNFHHYDNLVGARHGKKDPRRLRSSVRQEATVDLCWAASEGDLAGLRRLLALGVDLDAADYDGRTALHLAASEGHADVVDLLLARGARLDSRDRWGGTPLDDARREGHAEVVRRLERARGE